jgi:hypothetical protein
MNLPGLIFKYSKTFLILIIFTFPLFAQDYEYFGLKLGYSPAVSGWNDSPFNTEFYYNRLKNPPDIDNLFFGFNFELSRSKVYSTLFEADYRFRNYKFNTDKYNEFGQLTGTTSTSGDINYLSFSVSEKFRYNPGIFSLYAFAGLRADFFIIRSGFMSLLEQNSDMNTFMFGLNSGVGAAIGKKHRVSLEFYFLPDFTKHYSSSTGSIRYLDFGFSLGYGVVTGK